jgi:transposase
MRGNDEQQGAVFSYVSAEQRIAADHPLRRIRAMTDGALKELSPELDRLYASGGRPSIAPEKLLRALLLQLLYTRRSERLLMEEMNYNLLFRWFVGLEMDDAVWDVTVFTKNRERLLAGEISQKFLQAVVNQARAAGLLSDEHFTVDGTLIEAWANRRSFVEKPEPPQRGTGARGRKLLRDTHESKTDPEARLFRRSQAGEARPSYLGHVITENRNGLVVAGCVTQSSTKAEREAALAMLPEMSNGRGRTTLGADKGYQERAFLQCLRSWRVVRMWPNMAGNPGPGWADCGRRSGTIPGSNKARRNASGWSRCLAGSKRWRECGRPSFAGGVGWNGCSAWR